MKNLAVSVLVAAFLTVSGQSVLATGTMHSSMTMPKCAAGDPVVGVNMMSKTYMTHDQMKTKMAGMSNDQMHAAMMKNHMKMMCKSKASAMGAKMMKSNM